jgi:hypothetical protein
MTGSEAIHTALGYAWAAEDFSGTRTLSPTDAPGTLTFAEAFGAAWDEFNAGERGHMIPVMDAYRRWQESAGASIFAATGQRAA